MCDSTLKPTATTAPNLPQSHRAPKHEGSEQRARLIEEPTRDRLCHAQEWARWGCIYRRGPIISLTEQAHSAAISPGALYLRHEGQYPVDWMVYWIKYSVLCFLPS